MIFGCSDLFGPDDLICTTEMQDSLIVEVREAGTGAPAARGVTGASVHGSGTTTDLAAVDELRVRGFWGRELPGRHTITLQRPGYQFGFARVDVPEGECHVMTQTVEVQISSDPLALLQHAVSFIEGPEIPAWPPDASVQIHGDTLQISGFAPTNCELLEVVAFRRGEGLHVQVEPSDTRLDRCISPREFEVRYQLPSGQTSLLVTNGLGFPIVLFAGQVQPE